MALALAWGTACDEAPADGAVSTTNAEHSGGGGAPVESSANPVNAPLPTAASATPEVSVVVPSAPPVTPSVQPMPSVLATDSLDASAPSVEPSLDAGSTDNPVPTTPPAPSEAGSDAGTTQEAETEEGWGLDAMDDPLENPETCPGAEPAEGEPCTFGLVCKYGSEPDCRSRWVCGSNDTWYLQFAQRDCPGVCPEAEPSEGDACTADRVQCTFGPTATCRSHWMCSEQQWTLLFPADDCETQQYCPETPPLSGLGCEPEMTGERCTYEGAALCGCSCFWDEEATLAGVAKVEWYCRTIEASYPADYLKSCPMDVPIAGSACDSGSTCGYVTQAECTAAGTGTTLANCVDGSWVIDEPDPPQASAQ